MVAPSTSPERPVYKHLSMYRYIIPPIGELLYWPSKEILKQTPMTPGHATLLQCRYEMGWAEVSMYVYLQFSLASTIRSGYTYFTKQVLTQPNQHSPSSSTMSSMHGSITLENSSSVRRISGRQLNFQLHIPKTLVCTMEYWGGRRFSRQWRRHSPLTISWGLRILCTRMWRWCSCCCCFCCWHRMGTLWLYI